MNTAYVDTASVRTIDGHDWLQALDSLPPRLRLRIDLARVAIDPRAFLAAYERGMTVNTLLRVLDDAEAGFVTEAVWATYGAGHPDADFGGVRGDGPARAALGHSFGGRAA